MLSDHSARAVLLLFCRLLLQMESHGTWSPATINTAAVGTSTYTFTPAAGQCASVATVDIEIANSIAPAFNGVGPLCQGSPASSLPSASINGINGTWAPAAIRTSNVGTSAYTFTPAAGQCAIPVTLEVEITNSITPVFAAIGPLPLNSIAPALPSASTNGISGIWTPATINTSTTGTSTYTFTPAAGQCATAATMDIEVITIGPALMTVTKTQTSGPNPVTAAGQMITYTIVLTNTGSVNITGIVPDETYPGAGTGTISGRTESISNNNVLNVGENWRYTATYTTTAADISAGADLVNTISIVTNEVPGPTIANATTPIIVAAPAFTVTKTQTAGPNPITAAGQVITYTIVLTNTGSADITGIVTTETYPGAGAGTLSGRTESLSNNNVLNAGENWRYTATYTVTQADIDGRNNLVNTVRVVTTQIPGPSIATATTPLAGATSSVSITKNASESSFSAVGNVIHYTIVVTNTGNVTLTNIQVTDPLTGLNQTIVTLAPGASRSINTTHTIVQNDLNTGRVNNTATVSYNYGGNPYSQSANATVTANQGPDLTITKVANETSYTTAGDILHYTIVVSNTGNVTLTNIVVTDALTGLNQTIASLAPGANRSFSTTHLVVQNDLNTGSVNNTARATFTYGGTPYARSASVRIPANQGPDLNIIKSVTESGYSAVGSILHYRIVVTNTGNVTLSNIIVTDPLTGLNQTIPSLAPGANQTINTTHAVTQNDLNTGHVDNTATAAYNFGGRLYNETSNASVAAIQNLSLTVTKTVAESNFTRAGDILHYSIVIVNSGNVTLTNVSVTDPNAVLTCAGVPFTMIPGARITCTALHTVTANDITAGLINNTAFATGNAPDGRPVTGTSNTTTIRLNNLPPTITCPAPVTVNTSLRTCNALINTGLAATFSDPNNNIESLTWVMTGATIAASPSTGINNLSL